LLKKESLDHCSHNTSMMSDLAPFVAAVIRDRVVAELKDENEALRQENAALKLDRHKRNPRRSVKVTGSNGKEIFAENEVNLQEHHYIVLGVTTGRKFCFFYGLIQDRFHLESAQPDIPKVLCLKCGSLLSLELWIDGGSSVRLQDLSFHYTSYKYVSTHRSEYKYMAEIEARDGDDLTLEFNIFISPDDHAKVLNREQSVDFLPPETERENCEYNVENHFDQEIPLSHLLEICGEKKALFLLTRWECTEEWFFGHLMVPYEPNARCVLGSES
jgi:hypothetical protein